MSRMFAQVVRPGRRLHVVGPGQLPRDLDVEEGLLDELLAQLGTKLTAELRAQGRRADPSLPSQVASLRARLRAGAWGQNEYQEIESLCELLHEFQAATGGKAWPGTRLMLHIDSLDRYHGAAALVMTAGSLGMLLASGLALGPLWAGFLAGALPTFLLAALVSPEHA